MTMKKLFTALMTLGLTLGALLALSACTDQAQAAKTDATSVLNYIFAGKVDSNFKNASTESASKMTSDLEAALIQKQQDSFADPGSMSDYYVETQNGNVYFSDVLSKYAAAYMNETQKIKSFTVDSAAVKGDTATIKVTFKPIAALSEAHPIGAAQAALFGGYANANAVGNSKNATVEVTNQLISLMLFGYYYGKDGMNSAPEMAAASQTISFTLKKSGNHYVADLSTFKTLAKESRANVYAKTDSNNSSSSDSSSSASSGAGA